jgi:hypothetical protein
MPQGMFLLIHDEIRGPEIKCSYFNNPINLTKEFISKLYMSHAGFDSSSHIELKFENYRSVSCFTGNLDRRSKKEGILGIIFEENEEFSNLDLFLQRNLFYIIDNPNEEIMQDVFSNKLLNYLKLNELFEKVEIEGIPEIYLINGNSLFKYNILKIGEFSISIPEMTELYEKIINNQMISSYHYAKLDLGEKTNTYLVLKSEESLKTIKKLIFSLKYYIENYYYYSLEILTLLLLPSIIQVIPVKLELVKNYSNNTKSFIQNLQKSKNYQEEFNQAIRNIVEGNIYISPLLL